MKRWCKRYFPLLLLLLSTGLQAQISKVVPKRPDPPRLVNDFTGTLTASQLQALESKLVAYDDSTSNQIAVVIIPSTGDYPIEDVALQILRGWGVGNKKTNNGLVLLVSRDDRKLRIETGYGLEGAVPDGTASSIINDIIIPQFREKNYYRGIDEGVDAICQAAAGEYKAPAGYGSRKGKGGLSVWAIVVIVIVVLILFGAGAAGGAGGTLASGGGFRGWTGGGWSSGGGGSGWSGGGGFGGFGGGSGGGGGASGSW